ncbi:acyl-CoA synthetase [Nocardia terpenica]|uniref:Fatty-acid--CoA ligase n=1 Tax=Nocardia terpenica TaxID=455432 RepID=A0A164N1I7_9NOCA|nr:long-chain fatty acid--CoA ligase [Nocardia terpenica]KZM73881.1 fatty-acid--CoA ligase [Nocardia terpenica]NQE86835.1 long-chain fatty acid--CoA ligase [Nocardia terpenica]
MYLTQSLHRARQQHPARIASIHRGRQRTFAEQADRVARLAGGLLALGVEPGDRVAILALNSDRYLEYLMAVPWADAVLVPVNTRWAAAEIVDCLRDAEARLLVVDDDFARLATELAARCPSVRRVIHAGDGPAPAGCLDDEELIGSTAPVPDARRGGAALAALFYTGGTTGRPKGVMLSHDNLLTSALGCLTAGFMATPRGRFLHSAPMFHLGDLAHWLMQALVGNTQVTVPKFAPAEVLSALAEHAITDLFLAPTMLQALLDHPEFGRHDLRAVRRIVYAAAPMPPDLLDRVSDSFPGVELVQGYGMTELAPVATLLGPADHADRTAHRYSAGRAAAHSEIRVAGPDGTDAPIGTVGEILCRGGHVMLGYWRRPDLTAAVVRDGWMHTGDAGYLDADGYLYVVDRIKDMIITGGENVYSAEVESVLRDHPAVSACAVIGLPDRRYGERVHAVVVASGAVTADQLRAHVKRHLAGYKTPRSIDFVDELPVSNAGKILKHQLRDRYRGQEAGDVGGQQPQGRESEQVGRA